MIGFVYLISSICFILSLKGLSSPKEARFGNLSGIVGTALALAAGFFAPDFSNNAIIILIIGFAGFIGTYIAKKVDMTQIPELVAGFHSLVGLSAVLTSYAAVLNPEAFSLGMRGAVKVSSLIESSFGAAVGAVTFTGSLVAFGKLRGILPSAPFNFPFGRYFSILLALFLFACLFSFAKTESLLAFNLACLASLVLGIALIIPVGGADMPVVVSMLNSYSGFAASGIGFTLNNNLLVIAGALVGSSGAILSYIMCKAMNRSLFKVLFGSMADPSPFGSSGPSERRPVKSSSPEDAAYVLENSDSVIIIPGYGMAVGRAQHAVKEMVDILEGKGVKVRFAIHPVAGRMPGHMNVLLAEADIDYDKILELEEINEDFKDTDVVLVIGANDVTNPAAKKDPSSPIYGMPILNAGEAGTVFFLKRSTGAGYSGVDNELFYADNTQMLFGDAKKVTEDIVGFLKER